MSLSSLIVQRDVATMRQVEEALARQVIYGGDLATNLLETARVDEGVLTALLAESMHLAAGPVGELPLAAEFVRALVPADFALQAMAVPLDLEQQRMVLVVAEPLPPEMRNQLSAALGMAIEQLAAPAVRVWQGLARTYGVQLDRRMQRLISRLSEALPQSVPPVAAPPASAGAGSPARRSPASFAPGVPLASGGAVAPSRAGLAVPSVAAPPASAGAGSPARRSPASFAPGVPLASGGAVAPSRADLAVPSVAAPPASAGAGSPARRSPASFAPGVPLASGGAVAPSRADLTVGVKALRHPTLKSFPRMKVSSSPPSPLASGSPGSVGPSSVVASPPGPPGSVGPSSVVASSRATPSEHHAGVLQRSVGPNMRPSRRRRGPLTIETVRREAEEAGDRDVLLDLYFEFARQFFDYAALFLVQGDIAEGRDAFGSGAPRERVQGIGVPLDMPSMLSAAREKRIAILGSAAVDGLDAVLLGDLQRPPGIEVAALPLVVRTRAVALLIGDCGESGIDRDGVHQVLACARLVGKGFERIIVRRKLEGFVAGTLAAADAPSDARTEPPEEEAFSPPPSFDSSASAQSSARSAPPLPVAPLPERPPVPTETFPSGPSDVSMDFGVFVAAPPSPSTFRGPFDTSIPVAPPVANIASVRPVARPSIPREEPVPAAGEASSDAVLLAPAASARAALRSSIPREEPVPAAGEASSDAVLLAPAASARAALRSSIPREEPVPAAGELRSGRDHSVARSAASVHENSTAPTSWVGGEHSVARSAVPPPRSGRFFGPNPNAALWLQGAEATSFAQSSDAGQTGRQQSSPDGEVSSVVVPPHHPTAPRVAPETCLPTVIIDLDVDLAASVDRVVRGDADEVAEAELLHHGERAMPVIMQRFPGPVALDWSRLASMTHPPRASECGPILRLVARERKVALPFVLERLTSLDLEARGWATYLLVELPYAEAIPQLIERLCDEDAGIHIAAARAISAVALSFPDQVAAALKTLARSSQEAGRAAAARAMAEVRDAWVVPELIAGLRDLTEEVVAAVHHGLVRVTRQDFGRDARPWLRWWERNRQRHRVEWLIDALTHELPEIRRAAGEELRVVSRQYFGYASDLPSRDRERAQRRYRDWWITERRARQRYP